MDKLRSLEIFLATYDEGSFAAAAKTCHTDPSTVSKSVGRLEKELGLTLFQRSTRKLQITAAGKQYALTVRKLVQELSACEDDLKHSNEAPCGTLRISSAVCYGHLYLRPLLPSFCAMYPNIQLDIEVSDLHMGIIENNIDLVLRTGFVKDSRLIAKRLSPMDFLTCVSPQYLEDHGLPKSKHDFKSHKWIGFRIKETQQLQPIYLPDNQGEYQPYELTRSYITDDGETMAYMCMDGLGFAQLPHFLAKSGLERGDLVSVYPHFRVPSHDSGVFAIYPKRKFMPAKTRVFIDYLTNALLAKGESAHQTWASEIDCLIRFDNQ